ncbi:MAG: hypothetical protein M3P98_03335, partial [bacterium]|nr:hypothetical protein [bacterium]
DEVLKKIKEDGVAVVEAARQTGVNVKTIYGWLGSKAREGDPILEINRLKRENEGLTALVGALTVAAARQKKGLPPERWFQN